MASFDGQQQQVPRVIETASGTTSPDNAKSGNMAYGIAALALACMVLCGVGMRGCVSMVGGLVSESMSLHEYEDYDVHGDEDSYDLGPQEDDYYDFDDMIGDLYGENEESDVGVGTLTPEEALAQTLSLYSATVDNSLAASDYANADREVVSFVRELVLLDKNATSDVSTTLKQVAWGQKNTSEALEEANGQVGETLEALRALSLPAVEGDQADSISQDLETGLAATIERWEAIGDELTVINASESVSAEDLTTADEAVYDAAERAAEAFSSALTTSAKN